MLAGNSDFTHEHPSATKRVLRAILKATDLCVAEPARVAQRLVDGGFTPGTITHSRRSRGPLRGVAGV